MATINEIQDEIIEEFSPLDDWMDRYQLIIDMGESLEDMPLEYKLPNNIIEGCQSRVWIKPELKNGKIHLYGDSDAIIVRGIVSLLLRVLNNRTPSEILNSELYFIEKIGLKEHLSPTRSNGLVSMIKQIHLFALALSSSK